MRINQSLDKSKKYFQLSFTCKLRISSEVLEQLRKPSDDISNEVLQELNELGAIVLHKSAEFPDQKAVVTLTPFGDCLANAASKYKGV